MRNLTHVDIPQAMDDAGLEELKLPNGATLTVEEEFIPQFRVEDEEKAFTFLREAGYGDKLKNVITLEYGMKEDKVCEKVFNMIQAKTLSKAQRRTYFHPSTQRAVGRDLIEKGLSLPEEISIFTLRKIKLVKPKQGS